MTISYPIACLSLSINILPMPFLTKGALDTGNLDLRRNSRPTKKEVLNSVLNSSNLYCLKNLKLNFNSNYFFSYFKGFFCATNCFLDFLNWYIVHCYYRNIKQMSKLREEAIIPIPCPPPNYAKPTNTYSSGLKHSIINEYNYVA